MNTAVSPHSLPLGTFHQDRLTKHTQQWGAKRDGCIRRLLGDSSYGKSTLLVDTLLNRMGYSLRYPMTEKRQFPIGFYARVLSCFKLHSSVVIATL